MKSLLTSMLYQRHISKTFKTFSLKNTPLGEIDRLEGIRMSSNFSWISDAVGAIDGVTQGLNKRFWIFVMKTF